MSAQLAFVVLFIFCPMLAPSHVVREKLVRYKASVPVKPFVHLFFSYIKILCHSRVRNCFTGLSIHSQ